MPHKHSKPQNNPSKAPQAVDRETQSKDVGIPTSAPQEEYFSPLEKEAAANLAFLVAQIKEDRENVYIIHAGRVVQSEMGINKIEYLEDKSPEEKAARLSIARLLRSDSPLDYQLREHLAALFDPEEDTYPGGARRLVFKDRRNRGRYRDHFRNTQIVAFITERVEKNRPHQPQLKQRSSNRAYLRKSLQSAVCDAVNKFGVKERQIWNILGTLQQT